MRSRLIRQLLALVLAFVCCLPAGHVMGEEYPYTAYTTAALRLRQQPSENAAVIVTIPLGDAVLITGETGNYYILLYEGKEGFAQKNYLTVKSGAAAGTAVTPAPQQQSARFPVLYSGSSGEAVKALQQALKELGFYTSSTDGKFGAGTRSAVLAFQKMNGLSETGSADDAVQQLLYEGTPKNSRGKAATVKVVAPIEGGAIFSGKEGTAVSRLQARLKTLGYYKGSADGICGSGTVAAIQAFQKKNGLVVTGRADAITQTILYADTAIGAVATATPKLTPTPTPIPTPLPAATAAPIFPFSTYTLSAVNLRSEKSTASTRILTIPKGATISVLTIDGDYLKVTYNNRTGYIVAEYALVPAQYASGNTLTQNSEAEQNYPNLQSGAAGKYVTVLQEALKELGFYTGAADGLYGASTVAAVKAFQKKNNLRQDGIASPEVQQLIFEGRPLNSKGKKTDVKILPLIAGVEMKLNDKGEAVKELQARLAILGYYTGAISGTYSSATEKAVKKFQTEHHLYVDGKAGKKTLTLLNTLTATPAPTPYVDDTVIIITLPTVAPTPTPITAANVIVMQNGTRGLAVKRLQERLMELGYYTCSADAVYDADDIAAVREFQRKNGLKIDGIAGLETQLRLYSDAALPATKAALPTATPLVWNVTPVPQSQSTATSPQQTLKSGSKGESVAQMQYRLLNLGYYSGAIDGLYGTSTAQAVTMFQRANGLTADGVAGPQTLERIYSDSVVVLSRTTATPAPVQTATTITGASASSALLKVGAKGDQVKAVQQRLVELGYLTVADGIYGPKTYNAVVAFQKRNGLTADGIVGKLTLNKLNSSSAVASANASVTPAQPASTPAATGSAASFKVPSASEVRFANWFSEIRARARLMPDVVIYDPDSGLHYNLHMFSFGKHADAEPPTASDTAIMNQVVGESTWTPKYVWVIFSDGRVYIASTHSHGHEVDHTAGNGLEGHICLHFPRVMSEAEATGPYAVSHQKEILYGWEMTQAMIR